MNEQKDVQRDLWRKSGDLFSEKYWNLSQKRGIQLVEYFGGLDIESMFEIGCNSGRNLHYISKNMPGKKLGGLEIAPGAVAKARENIPGATIYMDDLHNMDTDDKYDVVFTGGVLMHIPIENVTDVIKSCIKKANKYVVHMEPVGDDIVLHGPKEMNPKNKIRKTLNCHHNIKRIYFELGFEDNFESLYEHLNESFIVVKVGGHGK